jgi:hypothetical protein
MALKKMQKTAYYSRGGLGDYKGMTWVDGYRFLTNGRRRAY